MALFVFWTSKLLYMLFYIIIPIYYLGWQPVLIGFLTLHLVMHVANLWKQMMFDLVIQSS